MQAEDILTLLPQTVRLNQRAIDVLRETFPCTTLELLPEWEATLGLPDLCIGPLDTIQQRQQAVCLKFIARGGQSADYYIRLAASIGYTITITTFIASPFVVDHSRVDEPLDDEQWAYVWQVNVAAGADTLVYFRVDESTVDEPLRGVRQPDAGMPAARRRASPYRDHLRLRIEVRMYRIDNATATSTLPTPLAPGPVANGYFQSGNPGIGLLATTVDRDWANATQEEFCTVIEAAGITLSKTDHTQLYQALQRLFVTRTKVTTNMTIYVSPTGSDITGNGLTPGTAFATIQAAINAVYFNYDWNGHSCTIQLADGTYNFTTAEPVSGAFPGMPFGMQQYGLTLQGNPSLPQNVILNATNASCILVDRALLFTAG